MLNEYAVKVKGILKAASLFTDDYIRLHKNDAVDSLYYPKNGEAQYFIGFKMDESNQKWTEFAHIGIDVNTGETRWLDYKLPSGLRMKNPIVQVRYA